MDRYWQMDAAGRAPNYISLIRLFVAAVFFLASVPAFSVDCSSSRAKQLFAAEQWQELLSFSACPQKSPDISYYLGTAYAKLERWNDAELAFRAGAHSAPRDKRFPEELAGVAFKRKQFSLAVTHLHRALALNPEDDYASDFLATIYFLNGNLEAALKYWNRVDKPHIVTISESPEPKLDPALLDRAFTFSPASQLRLPELLATRARVQGLGVFPTFRFDLQARLDGKFDLAFINRERNGWGDSLFESLLLAFRGLPFQTVYLDYFNLHHRAANITTLLRWDAQKRRAKANYSAPFRANPKWRYGLHADLRGENWDIRNSFTGPAPLLGSLNLRREALSADFTSFESGRWQWSVAAELSHRDFRSVYPGVALSPSLLQHGFQLKQVSQLSADLWRVPEHRLDLSSGFTAQLARLYSQQGESFAKLQAGGQLLWLPQTKGDDYETKLLVRGAKTFGDVPFDELFMLGVEHDNDLWMRAHIGTRDGRKGSAPLGRNYVLINTQMYKNLYQRPFFTFRLGPFLDSGKITDPTSGLGSNKWLWDAGAQATARVFGVGVVFCYGKDLRTGNNAFYITLERSATQVYNLGYNLNP